MPEIFYTRHSKNRMRWRGISRESVELTINSPEKIEDMGNDQFNFYKSINEINYKVVCLKETDRYIILSAIKIRG